MLMYCACECTGDERDRWCDLLVRYDPLELKKAIKLYKENPITGNPAGRTPYKKCGYCRMAHRG